MTDPISIIRAATANEDTVAICLHSGLNAEWERADRELREARAMTGDSLAPSEELLALAQRVKDIEDAMAAQAITFRLRALPPKVFRKLLEDHPPRRDDEGNADVGDLRAGYDRGTYPVALLKACTVEPQLPDDVWDELLTKLNAAQQHQLTSTASELNVGDVDVPFSLAASALIPRSASGSKQPSGSESASPASTETNPEPSPSTSTTPTDE